MSEESKEDFAPLVDEVLPLALTKAKDGDLLGAIEDIGAAEKKTRLAGASFATSKLCVAVINLCIDANDLKQLNTQILILSKRRGQLKQAISDIVQRVIEFIPTVTDRHEKLELITTLKIVTEGKIYVEVERARITKMLAQMKEEEGKIDEASEILQEVQIETYGSMEKKEKAEFIIEQVRLTLQQRDFVRMGILAQKMNKKVLDEEGMESLRLRYYELLGYLAHANHDSLALCKGNMSILETRGYAADESKWRPVLENAIIYLCLSPYSNEVSDLTARLLQDPRVEELPAYRGLLKLLSTNEIISWPLPAAQQAIVEESEAFKIDPTKIGLPGYAGGPNTSFSASSLNRTSPKNSSSNDEAMDGLHSKRRTNSSIVSKEDEPTSQWSAVFRKRIAQHNVRVCAKWFSRLSTSRAAELLSLDVASTEAVIAELISNKDIFARIDRPGGVINFVRERPSAEILSDWSRDLDEVLALIENTTHLIHREYMVKGTA